MLNLQSTKSIVRASILSAIYLLLIGVADAQKATDFAIFSTDDVSLETYSVVRGDVYSGRDLNVEFGYGIQVPSLNSGNMFAYENYTQESLSDIEGSVFANGDATLNGSADIHEDLTYGGVYNGSNTDVDGVIQQQSNTVAALSLPAASQFSAGTEDVITDSGISLAPGAYRNLSTTRSNRQIVLTSGNYYFRQLNFATSTTLSLQIIDNEPINVFVEGNADFGTYLNFVVNEIEIGTPLADSIANLASLVLFESHGDVALAGGISEFFGTIFAPSGNVNVIMRNMHGSIVSGRTISAEVYLDHQPSNYLLAQTATVFGDCNLDGVVSFLDIAPFIINLTTGDFLEEADCYGDGVISFLDIAPFIGFLIEG